MIYQFNDYLPLLYVSIAMLGLPVVIAVATPYLKINLILNFLKLGLGTQNIPSGMIVAIFSLMLSLSAMQSTLEDCFKVFQTKYYQSQLSKSQQIQLEQLVSNAYAILEPLERFWVKHTDAAVNQRLSNYQIKDNLFNKLFAFMLSELNKAFKLALIILVPFLVIDFFVANILVALGMYMFSPYLIALPLKILMIVHFDFWQKIFESLHLSYVQ